MVNFLKNYIWTSIWFKNPTIEKTRNPQSQYNNKTKQKVLVIADPLKLTPLNSQENHLGYQYHWSKLRTRLSKYTTISISIFSRTQNTQSDK